MRVQQRVGPFYDLNPSLPVVVSDTLNHRPEFGGEYDVHSVRHIISRGRPGSGTTQKVLFMGDSFMQGTKAETRIPEIIWKENLGFPDRNIEFLNAGCGSYSPLIFIAQFKELYPVFKPDRVVLLIDETDFGDDWMRYRPLVVRENGQVVAVRKTPVFVSFLEGLAKVRRQPFYIQRLAYKLWFTRLYLPREIRAYRLKTGMNEDDVFRYSGKSISPETYREVTEYFEKNINELIGLIVDKVGPENLVILRHPHLQELTGEWRSNVAPVLSEVTQKYGILYYDFTDDLRKEAGNQYADYYRKNDMHYNSKGFICYGRNVARFLTEHAFFSNRNGGPGNQHV